MAFDAKKARQVKTKNKNVRVKNKLSSLFFVRFCIFLIFSTRAHVDIVGNIVVDI